MCKRGSKQKLLRSGRWWSWCVGSPVEEELKGSKLGGRDTNPVASNAVVGNLDLLKLAKVQVQL